MTKGIFVHRTDSIYDDSPAEQYQFPRQYLTRVSACIDDWNICVRFVSDAEEFLSFNGAMGGRADFTLPR